ncbi:helix-turn-helix transcriptional regulator [Candidatus Woesearchaeota archaeon]|nr:helix-turn-helix transcriptional regulator [Candidatus Woesearchaeota archaeon]
MDERAILHYFRKQLVYRVTDFLVDNPGKDYSKQDIAKGAGLSRATVFNHWKMLEASGIVKMTRRFGKTRLYQLDTENEITKKMLELERYLISAVIRK